MINKQHMNNFIIFVFICTSFHDDIDDDIQHGIYNIFGVIGVLVLVSAKVREVHFHKLLLCHIHQGYHYERTYNGNQLVLQPEVLRACFCKNRIYTDVLFAAISPMRNLTYHGASRIQGCVRKIQFPSVLLRNKTKTRSLKDVFIP